MNWKSFISFLIIVCCNLTCTVQNRNESPDNLWTSPYYADKKYPHHLVNNEGNHIFIFNKTAWAYFMCKNPDGVLERASRDGANVIRVALEGAPYKEVLKMDMWPWGGTRENPDWERFNEKYWEQVRSRIQLALDNNIGINLTLYFTYHPEKEDAGIQLLYWRKVIKELGSFPNILCWEIMNEYIKNESFQDIAGLWFYENDPYKRPVITSAGTTDNAVFPEKVWMGMAVVHTCTGSTPEFDLEKWYRAVARNTMAYGKPAFNNESGRELRHKNDDGVNRRKQAWIWSASGAFFTFHTYDGCEGIDSAGYKAPGWEFMKPYSDFFSSLPYYTLYPDQTVFISESDSLITTSLSSPSRIINISYLCTRETGLEVNGQDLRMRLPAGKYIIEILKPSDLSVAEKTEVISGGLSDIIVLRLPVFKDDILIKCELIKSDGSTVFKGTE
jgi:hypothetical protein